VAWEYGSFAIGDKKRKAVRGDWYGVKDIARLTIVLQNDAQCKLALQKLIAIFAPNMAEPCW